MDKELEQREIRFTRYADDVLIFTKSEMAANRVMKSICGRLERKLFLKVNATKTKVVRPTNEKKKLKKKLSEYLKREKAIARPLAVTIRRVNEIARGWINYFRIGMMKQFMEETENHLQKSVLSKLETQE